MITHLQGLQPIHACKYSVRERGEVCWCELVVALRGARENAEEDDVAGVADELESIYECLGAQAEVVVERNRLVEKGRV